MKLNKGYSLVEIVIGLVIITVFIVITGSLVNASYTNYRLVLQRNEALDFAIDEMEAVLQSGDVEEADFGRTLNNMNARVTIEKLKDSNKVYDNIFTVTVKVEYQKSAKDTKKYDLTLQSLKIEE